MSKAKIEALKELGRLLLLAVIPVLVTWLGNVQDPALWVLLGTAILKSVDKAIHVTDKTTKNGLVPF